MRAFDIFWILQRSPPLTYTPPQKLQLTVSLIRIVLRNMKHATKKKVTLMLDADVYDGLQKTAGARKVGAYLSDLARPHVVDADLEAAYKAMAADQAREAEAREWIEGTLDAPIEAENVWQFER